MKKWLLSCSTLVFAAASSIATAADLSGVPSGNYREDPAHAYITFSYNHLGLSNPQLSFDDFTISLDLDKDNPANSTVSVNIDVSSVVTGSAIWRDHLTGSGFLDLANHPEITFQSTSIEAGRDGRYKVSGDLTIKGKSNPVSLDVTINNAINHPMTGKPVVGFQADGEVLRSAWGMGKFAPNISDEVTVLISAELGLVD